MATKDMTIKEIAQELGKSYITVLNYVKTGKIKGGRQCGRDWLVPRESVEQFLREGNATDVTELSVPIALKKE